MYPSPQILDFCVDFCWVITKFLLVGGEMNLSWERDFSSVGEGGMSKYLVIGSPLFLSRENPV